MVYANQILFCILAKKYRNIDNVSTPLTDKNRTYVAIDLKSFYS